MKIGVPKETKVHEYRVGLTPASVQELTLAGATLLIEQGAGVGAGFADAEYLAAGATLVPDAATLFAQAELVVKVKEPQAAEYPLLRAGQTLFTYLHLAPDPVQARALCQSGVTAIAYETVTDAQGGLPLLAPMSEVAGRLAVQVGAVTLQKPHLGRGLLLGGVPGVAPGRVLILGGGVVGRNAALIAAGMGAEVTVVDRSMHVLRRLAAEFGPRVRTLFATRSAILGQLRQADLVIGAVLVAGATAPCLVQADDLPRMTPGAVLVDVAIDQGGCFATSRPTTHAEPTYVEAGIVHYAVTNMPGAVPRTATEALNNATLPFVMALARQGVRAALQADPHLGAGLNVAAGQLVHPAVGKALGQPWLAAASVLARLP